MGRIWVELEEEHKKEDMVILIVYMFEIVKNKIKVYLTFYLCMCLSVSMPFITNVIDCFSFPSFPFLCIS